MRRQVSRGSWPKQLFSDAWREWRSQRERDGGSATSKEVARSNLLSMLIGFVRSWARKQDLGIRSNCPVNMLKSIQ